MNVHRSLPRLATLAALLVVMAMPSFAGASSGAVTALWRDASHLDLFKTSASGVVLSIWWEEGCDWRPWFPIHPEVKLEPGTRVTALWRSNHTHLDLFVTGTDGTLVDLVGGWRRLAGLVFGSSGSEGPAGNDSERGVARQ